MSETCKAKVLTRKTPTARSDVPYRVCQTKYWTNLKNKITLIVQDVVTTFLIYNSNSERFSKANGFKRNDRFILMFFIFILGERIEI